MCVICLKPAGVAITEENLKAMWDKNPHGAGLCFWENAKLKIEKGFMQFETFMSRVSELSSEDVGLHCRIATHGAVCPDLTHPFAIEQSLRKAKKACIVQADAALFHNGILSNFGDKVVSDTVDFVANVLAFVPADVRLPLLESIRGTSKFLLAQCGKFFTVGYFSERDGCKFSNLYWTPTKSYHTWTEGNTTYYSHYPSGVMTGKASEPAASTKKDDTAVKVKGVKCGQFGWWDSEDNFHPYPNKKAHKKASKDAANKVFSKPAAVQPVIVNQPSVAAALTSAKDLEQAKNDLRTATTEDIKEELKELREAKASGKALVIERGLPLGRLFGFGH